MKFFTRTCQQCGKEFKRSRKMLGVGKYCSPFCAHLAQRGRKQAPESVAKRIKKGKEHWNYRGADISSQGARKRAQTIFTNIGPCEVCGDPKSKRHHISGDPRDNSPENIQILCRRHHMQAEGTVRNLKLRTLQALREQLRAPMPEAAITPIASRPGMYGVNAAYVIQRLNECFGEDGWEAVYTVVESGQQVVTRCDLVMRYGKRTLVRHAFGGNSNKDRGDAFKGSCTDALTKAASMVGIAESVYMGLHNKPPSTATPGVDFDPAYEARILGQQPIEPSQIREFIFACRRTGKSDDVVNAYFATRRITSLSQMFKSEFNESIKWANKLPDDLTESWQAQLDQTKAKPANGETLS